MDHESDLHRQLAEVHERLARHERVAAMTIGGVVVLSAVILGGLVVFLLER